jgi:hypothetical protein
MPLSGRSDLELEAPFLAIRTREVKMSYLDVQNGIRPNMSDFMDLLDVVGNERF